MYMPDCDNCVHRYECSIRKELKEAREFIFNINREMSGRKDFILDGKRVFADKEGEGGKAVNSVMNTMSVLVIMTCDEKSRAALKLKQTSP